MTKFSIIDHQHKSARLRTALVKLGFKHTSSRDSDIYFHNCDYRINDYWDEIHKAKSNGARIVIFSHAAPVTLSYDGGTYSASDDVDLYLAQSPGQKEIMQRFGYPHRIEVIGWHYCDIKPFKPVDKVRSILLAPGHPACESDKCLLHNDAQDKTFHGCAYQHANKKVYKILRGMDCRLAVRFARDLGKTGLKMDKGVQYQKTDYLLESAVKAIEKVDMVVSNNCTFASLAIALGKPVVMYGQEISRQLNANKEIVPYQHWGLYKGYLRYPYEIFEVSDPQALIEYAGKNEAVEWRERFIGDPLDTDKLFECMNDL